jgi:hypothetical protein
MRRPRGRHSDHEHFGSGDNAVHVQQDVHVDDLPLEPAHGDADLRLELRDQPGGLARLRRPERDGTGGVRRGERLP